MPLELNTIIPPAPTTERGQGLAISAYKKKNAVVYGNGLFVYARSIDGTNAVLPVHRNKFPVTATRVSPSQSYCASGDKNGNVVVWALDNEQNTVKIETQVTSGPIKDMCFSGDNQRLVAVGESTGNFASAFMVDGGSTVGNISGHTRNIMSCDMRLERPFRVATGSEDTEVNFYEGPPFKFKQGQKHHTNTVNCVRFSPSGDHFITVGSDKKIYIYDGKTGDKVDEIPCDHAGSVYSVAWHPSGSKILTASADKTVKLWDVESKKCLQTFKLQDKSVDYMQVACAYVNDVMCSVGLNGDLNIFAEGQEQPKAVLRGHAKPVTAIAVDGETVVTCSSDPAILLWANKTHAPEKSRRPAAKKMHGSAISGAVITDGKVFTCSMDDTIAVTSLDSAELTLLPNKVSGGPNGIVVMGGNLVITTNKGIYVMSKEGEELSKVATSYTPSCCATNGKVLLVGSKEKKVFLYAMKGTKLEQIEEIAEHKAAITAVAWSHDGSKFATGDQSREILMWEYTGSVKMLSGVGGMCYHNQCIKSLAFSPSGKRLVSGSIDTHVIVWELEKETRMKKEYAHLGGVNTVAFLSEDEVLSTGQDSAIRTWTITA
eukprot:TRINITY_DN26879_c0_g1_i1.p1 TRINITY_DN26879_c0_g1~~TRINITY_DN26879_c0_g1_i1.p1  ORF type:complete len:601 (+),score=251.37 TRINITY_DN26879_c0_g1_i1:34-1836(+)